MDLTAKEHTGSVFLDVLRVRPFRRLWLGQIASQLAMSSMLFVLALRVYQTTSSNVAVSGIFLSYGIPALLFGMAAGSVVDQLDKRFVLLFCDLSRAILALSLLFLSENIAIVYAITFLNSVISQFYIPAEASLIPQVVPVKRLLTANSMFSFTYYSSLAVGTVLSGPLLRLLSVRGVFLTIALMFLAAAASISGLPVSTRLRHELSRIARIPVGDIIVRIAESVIQGVVYVRRSPKLADALLLLTGTQILLSILGTLGPGLADQVLKIDIHDASVVLVGPAIAGIIAGALWVGQLGSKTPPQSLIKPGIIAAGILLLLVAFVVHIRIIVPSVAGTIQTVIIPVTLILFFFLGAANSMLDVPANSILQKEAEGALRGRVYGMLTAAIGGIGVLPVLIGGVLADALGTGTVILLLGTVVLSYGIIRVRYNTA